MVGKEILVASLQYVEFRVIKIRVLIEKTISLTNKATHSWATFRRKLTMKYQQHPLFRAFREDGLFEKPLLNLVLLMQV